jgi:acyl-[acyl-carrier-protein] desaturase
VNASALTDLEPVVGRLLDRHLSGAREWFPHELVPWDRGAQIKAGKPWQPPPGTPLSDGVRSAIFINLLTEDNLPYYTSALASAFGAGGAWGEWMRRWTAEEGRHSIVLRDWVTVSRLMDPVLLERARMQQVSGGVAPEPWSAVGTMVYVALQELATRIAHFNTAKALDDPAGYEIMKRVAADENLHFLFYRDLVSAAIELDPSDVVTEVERVVQGFAMPGTGIVGYRDHAASIADEGIYSLAVFHDQVLAPTLRFWKVEELAGLDARSSVARDRLLRQAERVRRIGQRLEEKRQERSAPGTGESRPASPEGPTGRRPPP